MTVGKSMRLKRVIDPSGVSIICALDHGMTSPTFLEPLADIASRAAETVAGGANVIMMSKGMIRIAEPAFSRETSLAMLLSASAMPDGTRPEIVQIGEVEEALRLGAVDYIAKPFDDLDRIAARIDDALRQMKTQYERRSAAPQLRLVGSANDPPDDGDAGQEQDAATPIEILQGRVRHATSDLRRRSLHLLSRLVASKAAGREVLLSGEALLDDLRHIRGAGGADRGELRRIEEKLEEHLALARHAQSR